MSTRAKAPKPQTCRMFETPLIERFSRVHPAIPFVVYIPALFYFAGLSVMGPVPLWQQAMLVLAGILVWTLTEYLLHRYLFHYMGPRPWQRRLYFIVHGVHHDFPSDPGRLVMPIGASLPLAVILYVLFRVALGPDLVNAAFVGFGIGYLVYDGIHYATHHFKMTSRVGKYLKRYHMIHHHTGESSRWGVSSPLWDWVFGTMGTPHPAEKR